MRESAVIERYRAAYEAANREEAKVTFYRPGYFKVNDSMTSYSLSELDGMAQNLERRVMLIEATTSVPVGLEKA